MQIGNILYINVFSTGIKQYRDHHTIEQIQKQVATLNLFQMYFHLTDMKIEKKCKCL